MSQTMSGPLALPSVIFSTLVMMTAACGTAHDASSVASIAKPGDIVVDNGRVFDPSGPRSWPKGHVVVRGNKILGAGRGSISIPKGVKVIHARGGTIMPGLIDAHVHLSSQLVSAGFSNAPIRGHLRSWIEGGITTVRDVGAPPAAWAMLKCKVDAEGSDAPGVVWAGPILTTAGGYPTPVPISQFVAQEVTSPEQGRTEVQRLNSMGARVIKLGLEQGFGGERLWPLMPLDVVKAIAETAHEGGLLVTAHATSPDEVRLALEGGVDNLAHTPTEALPDDLIAAMVAKGVQVTSTLAIFQRTEAGSNLTRFVDSGGKIAVGTDFGCCNQIPGIESFLQEVQMMRLAGLSPEQILVAATQGGAEVSNLGGEVGTLKPGARADILVVRGNPLKTINDLKTTLAVIRDGKVASSLRG